MRSYIRRGSCVVARSSVFSVGIGHHTGIEVRVS
jgi:hypothetical protein